MMPGQASGVTAMYDLSDDYIPVYDKSAIAGFYHANGTSGNQFKCCAVAGTLMAELVDAVEGGYDHDAGALQLPLRYTGKTLDSSIFSRLRNTRQSETSGTVLG